ncbi:unnamed protein product [Adineta ricciae]|uniref:Fumarylacetoacetase n=1 Tax=Adineta ricciae TaxID=249248 RepID=A0A815BHG0_ADIRI|nr:unnamed protein product [Adineta ricciae]
MLEQCFVEKKMLSIPTGYTYQLDTMDEHHLLSSREQIFVDQTGKHALTKQNHPYLTQQEPSALNIDLQVTLKPAKSSTEHTICQSNLKYIYWSLKQMLVHHSSTGCNLRPGDLIGTGTISGPTPDSCGSLLEIIWRGTKPLQLDENTTRKFLEDGDTIKMTSVFIDCRVEEKLNKDCSCDCF